MSLPSLLAELEVAVKIGTPEKRRETLRRVTSLFLDKSNHLNEQQIGVFDNVLVHLVKKIEASAVSTSMALVELSKRLAPVENAPIETIRRLARHDEIAIAGPVLNQSSRLSDSDLLTIAKFKSQSHLLAISGRSSLSEAVTDALIERGDMQVHYLLAGNSGAQFSESGFAALVKESEGSDSLAERLGLRLDIPLKFLRQILARATDLVRSRLLASQSPENQEKIQRAFASIANEIGDEEAGPNEFSRPYNVAEDLSRPRAYSVAEDLNRRGKLTEESLVDFIKRGRFADMTVALALFCAAKADLIEDLLKNESHDGLIVACKAARLSWPTVSLILRFRLDHPISERELGAAKSAFLTLSQTAAQSSMQTMQAQDLAKQAG
jgi:uncharacterized protein (DUF2336 family)